jgi:hypothetical protein
MCSLCRTFEVLSVQYANVAGVLSQKDFFVFVNLTVASLDLGGKCPGNGLASGPFREVRVVRGKARSNKRSHVTYLRLTWKTTMDRNAWKWQ